VEIVKFLWSAPLKIGVTEFKKLRRRVGPRGGRREGLDRNDDVPTNQRERISPSPRSDFIRTLCNGVEKEFSFLCWKENKTWLSAKQKAKEVRSS